MTTHTHTHIHSAILFKIEAGDDNQHNYVYIANYSRLCTYLLKHASIFITSYEIKQNFIYYN